MHLKRWNRRDILYFGMIGFAEILIYFRNPGHFFMGDSLLWIGFRYRSIAEFLRGFIAVDPTLWYRPLAQRTVGSLLYPLVGLNPIPYHAVMFVLFFACTIAVFQFTVHLTGSKRTGWLTTLIFVPNVTHAFTTYDVAFVPEMVFTLFFIGSAAAWVAWLRTQSRKALIVSAALFVGSLLSKESAVALPFALLAIWLCLPTRARLRSLAPHFTILLIYLVFAIGYLHIRAVDFRGLISRPGTAGQPGYELVLGNNILESGKLAFSWAFGIPRGTYGGWALTWPWMLGALRDVRVLIAAMALCVLLTSRRKYLLIGLSWFFIAASPTLPLVGHFLPFYLFLPMVGFSLAVGSVLDWGYECCAGWSPRLAFALSAIVLLLFAVIEVPASNAVSRTHFLLGRSAANARNGLNDVLAHYPALPKGATLVIFDEENGSFYWDEAHGMLFQMAYRDDSIKTIYSSDGIPTTGEDVISGKAFVFKLAAGRLADITSFVKQHPEILRPHRPDENYGLDLSKPGAMKIPELRDATLNVFRVYNGVTEEPFQVKLDRDGEAAYKADRAGAYTFVAIQRAGASGWVTVNGTVRVE